MALYNAVRYNYGDLEGRTMVIDLSARTTNLLFLEQNRVFSRSIPIAGQRASRMRRVGVQYSVSRSRSSSRSPMGSWRLGGAYEEPESETQARGQQDHPQRNDPAARGDRPPR